MEYVCNNDNLVLNIEDCFPDAVDKYLEGYVGYLERRGIDKKIVANVREFHRNIHICLAEYYYGQHGAARGFFNMAMKYIDIRALCSPMREEILYRARAGSAGKSGSDGMLTKEQMFHIPLDKRYLVSTERYSFPGLPCLYLGASYEVCCAELGSWEENLCIAKIEKRKGADIKVLDLSFFDKYDICNLDNEKQEKLYSLWPMIACCSFTYKESKGMKFRSDYIIPQLLLEYIIDTNYDKSILGIEEDIVGIRYRTVKKPFFDFKEGRFNPENINYVFPALSNEKSGHCPKLKDIFEVTGVFKLKDL